MQAAILERVRSFDEFDADNDLFGRHNCGSFDLGDRTILWQIDLDDRGYDFYEPDPTDPAKPNHVLTIMLAEEY
jgi:hypothetical protein